MRRSILIAALLVICSCGCQKPIHEYTIDKDETQREKKEEEQAEPIDHIYVGYVTWWDKIMPDLQYITHLNYSFGKVASTFDKVEISKPARLTEFVKARNRSYPGMKVLLSIGGWGAGNFSEMAADEKLRKKFCQSCLDACKQYGLDGIDLDWEYPTSNSAGISCSPNDTKNFTLLLKDMREAIGKDRLLTMASSSSAKYVDFKSCIDYLDFVNIMTYDMGRPPQHNGALYKSDRTYRSVDESVALHHNKGIPYSKIVVGVPFYGKKLNVEDSVDYRDIDYTGLTRKWDEKAMVPYLVDETGTMILTYDDAESVALKGKYVVEHNLLGVMVWNLEADDDNWTLSKALSKSVFGK